MPKKIELAGYKFGRWTVIEQAPKNPNNKTIYWKCSCECGKFGIVASGKLRNGKSKSCGCLAREITGNRFRKHGGIGTRLYRVWDGIKERCNNSNHSDWKSYGGKGIKLCEEWLNFSNFESWAIANGYNKEAEYMKCTIDRIDYNANYCPSNCRFVDMLTQNRNKPARIDNKSGTKGVYWSKTVRKWTCTIGVNYKRINLGYFTSLEEAVIARKNAEIKYWGIMR